MKRLIHYSGWLAVLLVCVMGSTTLTVAHRNAVNIETDLHCVASTSLPSSDVQTANLTAINAYLASATRYDAVIIPCKTFYVNGDITTPSKVNNPMIVGEGGRSYRLGNTDIGGGGIGRPRPTIVNTAGTGHIIVFNGWGGVVSGVTLQGRNIPTNESSGVTTRCPVGIEIAGNDPPHTGGLHLEDVTFVDIVQPIHASATPNESHADDNVFDRCVAQGCGDFFVSDNQQSVCNVFNTIQIVSADHIGGVNSVVFNCNRGGMPRVTNLILDTPKITVLKMRDFSPNNNSYVFHGIRYDTPTPADTNQGVLTLVDFSGAENYRWHIRMEDVMICAHITTDYDPSLLIVAHSGGNGVRDTDLSIEPLAPFISPPAELQSYRQPGPPASMSTVTPHSLVWSDSHYNDPYWLNNGVVTKAP